MEVITYNGQRVTKPIGYAPIPKTETTIIPCQRPNQSDWAKVIREELNAMYEGRKSTNKDCELYVIKSKEYHL